MEIVYYSLLSLGAAVCAYRAMLAKRLLSSALYLACVSAMVSAILYLLGAAEVAVIELSVGAGLVTVVFVYALSVVGEDARDPTSVIPKPFAMLIVVIMAGLIGWMAFPLGTGPVTSKDVLLSEVLWERRALDVWVQIVLIFSGVLGVLGLLAESKPIKVSEQLKELAEEVSEEPAEHEATA